MSALCTPAMTRRLRCAGLLGIGTLLATLGAASAAPAVGLPVRDVALNPPTAEVVYEGVDYRNPKTAQDDRAIRTSWRVVEHTGNSAENYLTTTPDDMLLDFGGNYLSYSHDRGKTWRQVQPLAPMATGEGGVVAAPGGDVLGVGYDPAGDLLLSFKYEADTKQWQYAQMPLHEPLYDREYIGVAPGPITILGETYEYVSFIIGGVLPRDNWFYSTDGLNYLPMPSSTLQQLLSEEAVASTLPTSPDPLLDWVQPNTNSGMTALGGGGMLNRPNQVYEFLLGDDASGSYGLLDGKTFSWSSYKFPDGSDPDGALQVDSAGRIHNVLPNPDRAGFAYRVSGDGGATWRSVDVPLPPSSTMGAAGRPAFGSTNHQWDFRANLAAGVAAVGIRAHDAKTATESDLVYKFDITGDAPKLSRLLRVGLGDVSAGIGTSGGTVRMDFGSIAIFSDGRVAASFVDSTTTWTAPNSTSDPYQGVRYISRAAPLGPAIAIEGETVPRDAGAEPAKITMVTERGAVRPSPLPDNTTDVTATVLDADGQPVSGVPVSFSFQSAGSGNAVLTPSLSSRVATTDDLGRATITYTSGGLTPGNDVIAARAGSARGTVTIMVTPSDP